MECPTSRATDATEDATTTTLRDHLLSSLSRLPTPQRLDLTVLTSIPKRTGSLFPYAAGSPRCFEKEFLVVLSADEVYTPKPQPDTPEDGAKGAKEGGGLTEGGGEEHSLPSAKVEESPATGPAGQQGQQETTGSENATSSTVSTSTATNIRPVLIVALQAYLYTIPSSSTSILCISKLDTSGYSTSPLSLTKELITSFIGFHLHIGRFTKTVKVALFARSQGQYLFPNSIKGGGKRVSGGLRLCGWWKGVYEEVARRLKAKAEPADVITLNYLLPSYSAAEALGMLGQPRSPLPQGVEWTYAPPFQHNLYKPPSEGSNEIAGTKLAWSIPALPDDPKTRFMDELVLDQMGQMGRGQAKRPKEAEPVEEPLAEQKEGEPTRPGGDEAGDGEDDTSLPTFINAEQNGSTSFITTTTTTTVTSTNMTGSEPATKRNRTKERQEEERVKAQTALNRVSPEEFWERMGFRQECASGDVTGFFHLNLDTCTLTSSSSVDTSASTTTSANHDPPKSPLDLRPTIVDRVHKSLLNCDFANIHYAVEGTAIWQRSARAIVVGEIGEPGWKGCLGTVHAKEGAELVGEKRKEQVTMLQPRKKQKVGEVNTLLPRKKEAVNVLQPRKK